MRDRELNRVCPVAESDVRVEAIPEDVEHRPVFRKDIRHEVRNAMLFGDHCQSLYEECSEARET